MMKLYSLLRSVVLVSVFTLSVSSSLRSQCTATGTQLPATTLTPTTAWQTASTTLRGGYYTLFNVTSGRMYEFSLCTADGGSASYDSELTLYNNASLTTAIYYSDDYCGDDAKIFWIASFTGVVRVKLNQYPCATNATNTTLRYRYTTPCNLTTPPGSVPEGETCGTSSNDGCNSPGQNQFGTAVCGRTIAGTCWSNYSTGLRDTDWYSFVPGIGGNATWSVQTEFPAMIAIVDITDCNAPIVLQAVFVPPCSTASVTAAITAFGLYAAFVSTSDWYPWTCGVYNDYYATLTLPSVPASVTPAGTSTICSGQTQTLTANSGSAYSWSPGGQTTQSIPVTTSGTYSVTVTDANGCRNTASSTVTVNPTPNAVATALGATTICPSGSVTITGSGGTTYSWLPGGQTTSSITVSAPGSYSVIAANGTCLDTSNVIVVTNLPAPNPIVTAGGPTTFCQGSNVTLTSTAANGYSWNPGGQTTQSVVVTASGNYVVTVTDANGCTGASTPIAVTVNPAPSAIITASGPTSFCQGGTVTLTASAGASWLWSPGGQTTQSIAVAATGNYAVTVTDPNGCSATSSATNVTVNAVPVANITPSGPTSFCQGGTVTLTSSPGQSYAWSPGGQTSQTLNVNSSGTYSVTVSNGNCTATSTPVTVNVNPLPTPTVTTSGPTTFCQGNTVTLTSNYASGNLWAPSGGTSQTLVVGTSGTVVLQVTDANGCSAASAPTPITVNPLPQAVITASGATTFCQGGSVTLTSSPGTSYLWSDGSTTPTINATQTGNYTVTVTDANGCSQTSQAFPVTVGVPVTPTVTNSSPLTFCNGGRVQLTSSPGASYSWAPGGQTSGNITVTQSGNYTVTVTDPYGCVTTSAPATVTVLPGPLASVYPPGIVNVCQGGTLTLTGNGGGNYTWSNGGNARTTVVTAPGTYYVVVDDSTGCADTSDIVTVFFLTPVTPTITASGPLTFCSGSSVNLTSSPGLSYNWSPGGGTMRSLNVYASGNYFVTTTDSNGCPASSSPVSVTVRPAPPTPVITQNGNTLTSSALSGNQWLLNGVAIPGATGQTYTITQSGVYSVQITDANGCKSQSGPFNAMFVGTDPGSVAWNFGIFPNPGPGIFRIRLEGYADEDVRVRVTDMLGHEVMTGTLPPFRGMTEKEFDVRSFGAGVYFVELQNSSVKKTAKVVVE